MKLQKIAGTALMAGGLMLSVPTLAATATGNLTVQITLAASCSVQPTTLTFNNPGTLSNNVDNDQNLMVKCSNTTPYVVGFDPGANPQGTQRRMKLASSNTYVNYQIFKEAARTTPLSMATPGTVPGTGSGNNQNITVYGRVPPQALHVSGVYTDTVLVTVTY